MLATGLLWYDDDASRPLAYKLAEAAERYRERLGYEPTACQLNPAQAQAAQQPPASAAIRRGAKRGVPLPPITLRLIPAAHLRPNYFFVGVEEGDQVRRVPGWHDDLEDLVERTPARQQSTRPLAVSARSAPSKIAAARTARPAKTAKTVRARAVQLDTTASPTQAQSGPEQTPTLPATTAQQRRRSAKAEMIPAETATSATAPTTTRPRSRPSVSASARDAAIPEAPAKPARHARTSATSGTESAKTARSATPAESATSKATHAQRPARTTETETARSTKKATSATPAAPIAAPATRVRKAGVAAGVAPERLASVPALDSAKALTVTQPAKTARSTKVETARPARADAHASPAPAASIGRTPEEAPGPRKVAATAKTATSPRAAKRARPASASASQDRADSAVSARNRPAARDVASPRRRMSRPEQAAQGQSHLPTHPAGEHAQPLAAAAPDRPKRPTKATPPAEPLKPATTAKAARSAKAPATPPSVLPVTRRKRPGPPAASQATLWSEPEAEAPTAPARRRKTA